MSSAQSMRFRSRWRTADHRLAMGARISTVPEERRGCECSTTFGYDRSSACGAGDRPSWDGGGGLRSSGLPNPATLPSARQTKKTLMMATAPRKLTSPRLPLQVVPARTCQCFVASAEGGGAEARAKSRCADATRSAAPVSDTSRHWHRLAASPLPTAAAPRLLHFEKEDRGSRWRRRRDANARVPRYMRRAAAIARLPARAAA